LDCGSTGESSASAAVAADAAAACAAPPPVASDPPPLPAPRFTPTRTSTAEAATDAFDALLVWLLLSVSSLTDASTSSSICMGAAPLGCAAAEAAAVSLLPFIVFDACLRNDAVPTVTAPLAASAAAVAAAAAAVTARRVRLQTASTGKLELRAEGAKTGG
jgi:hypothetical protein